MLRPRSDAATHALLLLALLLPLAAAPPRAAEASSVRSLSLSHLAERCELAFEGRVVAVRARKAAGSPLIHTEVTFEVLEVLHGRPSGPELTLRFLGGEAGERRLEVSDVSIPPLGERGIYFVESTTRRLVHPLLGWAQGRLPLALDAAGTWRVTSAAGKPIVALEKGPRRPRGGLSRGVAKGLEADAAAPLERALPASALKRAVRRWASRSDGPERPE